MPTDLNMSSILIVVLKIEVLSLGINQKFTVGAAVCFGWILISNVSKSSLHGAAAVGALASQLEGCGFKSSWL